MTALATMPVARQGTGWQMEILPKSFLLRLDSDDETAMKRAMDDLASWSQAQNWAGEAVGFDDLGYEVWVFLWEPSITSW